MNETLERKKAVRVVKDFKRKFGPIVLDLTSHAALAVAFNSELLHLIRINFFIDISDSPLFTAETDIQLSSLCLEIDDDLYEIPRLIRDHLLQRLYETYGHERVRELAALIWQYAERFSPWRENDRLDRAQKLTALHFLNPEKAKNWFDDANTKLSSTEGIASEREWFTAMYKKLTERDSVFNNLNSKRLRYNRTTIRKLIDSALTDEGLETFCFKYFSDVYDEFMSGQTRNIRILMLVSHIEKNDLYERLINEIDVSDTKKSYKPS